MSYLRMPTRIRLERRRGWRLPEDAVSVARPHRWGNPFTVAEHGLERALELFREYVADMHDDIRCELAGKDLACWCSLDQTCHADILLEIANSR